MNPFLILLLISRGADEPRFVQIPATRSVSGHGAVLDDLESRMPAQHPYLDRDRITWAHETQPRDYNLRPLAGVGGR